MSCFFVVDTCIDEHKGRGSYDECIEQVVPIVERCGGKYIVRSEKITSLSPNRNPQCVIIISFPSREALTRCFESDAYKAIMNKRIESVDARGLIVEEDV